MLCYYYYYYYYYYVQCYLWLSLLSLVSLVLAVRADINQMSKVSQQYPFLDTFFVMLVVPNNANFRTCSVLTCSIPRFSIYFSNFIVIVPNAPTTMGITTTFFTFFTLTNRISRSFLVLYHTLVLPDIATSIIIVSFFTLSTTTISGHLDSIM